jgi:hypothetical protein
MLNKGTAVMEKWEYKVIKINPENQGWFRFVKLDETNIETQLNELGSEGWELVSMTIILPIGVMCALKRPS